MSKFKQQFDEPKYDFMRFMQKRAENIQLTTVRPTITPGIWLQIKQAATTHQRRNRTDPFAYNRAILAMKQGIYTHFEVEKRNLSI